MPQKRTGLPNRVHADGHLVASRARGTLMGNRGGQFHDPATQTVKKRVPWANKQWISCVLAFKDRRRTVWTQGYTELFFLDEVTALSAGHRPCFECRRVAAKAFQSALFRGCGDHQGWEEPPKVAAMDALLHTARTCREKRRGRFDQLPVGTLVALDEMIVAITPAGLRRWTLAGYEEAEGLTGTGGAMGVLEGHILTPAPIVATLAAGYEPGWHPSMTIT